MLHEPPSRPVVDPRQSVQSLIDKRADLHPDSIFLIDPETGMVLTYEGLRKCAVKTAVMRRFVFKIDLEALPADKAERAFRRFFDEKPPRRLRQISGLTPGDFAVVARQLRFGEEPASPERIVDLLQAEVRAKPGTPGRIGFRG